MVHEYVGNVHFHTTCSDGAATLEETIQAAHKAELDFIIPTDHNIYLPGLDGWRGRTLLLIGQEIHDVARKPQVNHYLVFDVYENMSRYASDPQQLIDEVRQRGGFGFLAHPVERPATRFHEPGIPWVNWEVQGYAGMSLWNYMSEFKSHLSSVRKAILAVQMPVAFIKGPFPETLAKWDSLLSERRLPIIGASDAHGIRYRLGPLRGVVFPYEYLFRCVNLHLLAPEPFSGELEHDKRIVYDCIKGGRSLVAYDLIGSAKGFRFTARAGPTQVGIGEELALHGEALLHVTAPQWADLRLIHQGRVVAHQVGKTLEYTATEKGPYRVEARRPKRGRWRGWVFTNPLYLI